jgi:uncharacterized small protein (DUF1192 family)
MKISILLTVLLFGIVELGKSQNPLILDLGVLDPGTTYSVNKNKNVTYDYVVLKNAIFGYKYSISIEKEVDTIPPLSFKASDTLKITTTIIKNIDNCNKLIIAIKSVDSIYNDKGRLQIIKKIKNEILEHELAKRIAILKSELRTTKCEKDDLKEKANKLITQSCRNFNEILEVATGESITIKVKRDSLEWIYIIKGEPLGKWVTSYGFGFTSSFLEGSTYYTKQVPDSAIFQILKSNKTSRLDLNYIPAVFFSYCPAERFNKFSNLSWTAGLGFDLSSPVVFFGGSLMIWQNIGLSLGVAFQQEYRLKDQYSESEFIKVSLDKEQLHDKIYRPNIFLSVNFRFGENPFKTNQANSNK